MARWFCAAAALVLFALGCGGPSLSDAAAELEDMTNDPKTRLAAVDDLVATGEPEAVEHLHRVLADEGDDPRIRARAAGGLGFFQNPDSLEPLVEALGDPDPEVRRQAGRSLVQFGALAVPYLIRALAIAPEESDDIELYAAGEERRIAASRALVAIGQPAVGPLKAALAEYERDSFYWAMHPFANPKLPLAKEVAAAIQGLAPDPEEDFAATKVDSVGRFLNRIGNENAVPRRYITLSLQSLQSPPPTYLETLRADPKSRTALEVTERVFGQLKMDAINPLIAKRESEEKSLQIMCTHFLGYLGVRDSTSALVDILADTSEYAGPEVKRVALESLGRVGTPAALAALFDALKFPELRDTAADELEANGAPAQKLLLAKLTDRDPTIRAYAIWFFGHSKDAALQTAALPKLLENMTQDIKVLRENAAVALGKMPAVAFDKVAALAEDARPGVRQAVAISLGEMALPEARPYLEKLAADQDPAVRQSAQEALLRL